MSGLVYLIKPADYSTHGCFKIGMSNSSTIHRLRSYGYECNVIIARECANPIEVEKRLIESFRQLFGPPLFGKEWFTGNKTLMIKAFDNCFANHANYLDDDPSPEPEVKTVDTRPLVAFTKRHVEHVADMNRGTANMKVFHLLRLLPDVWFEEKLGDLVKVVRTTDMTDVDQRATVRELMLYKRDSYNEVECIRSFECRLSKRETRKSICSLKKIIKQHAPIEYSTWEARWKYGKSNYGQIMKYKEGALEKLSDLKSNHKGELTAKLMAQMDPRWTHVKRSVCKGCGNIHLKGCCGNYNRIARTSVIFIQNVKLL